MTLDIFSMLCKKCGVDKPIEQFKKNKNCKTGYEYTCKECTQKRQKKWEHENITRHRENQSRWRSENLEQYKEKKSEWYLRNKDKGCEQAKKFAKDNPDWKRSATAKRRAQKLKAIPSWANMKSIREIYRQAKKQGLVVDHVIPLQGKLVCGLHVENNLQLLTASENSVKHNKYTVN